MKQLTQQLTRSFFVFITCFSSIFSHGTKSSQLQAIDSVINAAIKSEALPGAVVLVSNNDQIVYYKAFGNRSMQPSIEPMTLDTIFDIASLTKPFTATAIVKLAELGLIDIDLPVATYIPEFGANGKEQMTIKQLLVHSSGLLPDIAREYYEQGYKQSLESAYNSSPLHKQGKIFTYSSVGYIVLGELIQRVSGKSLQEFYAEHIFKPLDMRDTMFLPPQELYERIAPTEKRNGVWLRGQVHDPSAYAIGGAAGHAGIFSTALDLAKFCSAFLNKEQVLHFMKPISIESMITRYPIEKNNIRGLGWDIDTRFSSFRGNFFREGIFGHTGFTGTSMLLHQPSKTFIIILSNRVHPDGKGNIIALRAMISNIVASALEL